jgi:hypothetical protein
MNRRSLTIEVDAATAEALENRAADRGISLSAVVTALVADQQFFDANLARMQRERRGPYAEDVLREDARRLAAFLDTRHAIPWEEAADWICEGGSASDKPMPKPRRI